MIMETKPFQNKLRTKILTFEYEKIAEPDHTANLIEVSENRKRRCLGSDGSIRHF